MARFLATTGCPPWPSACGIVLEGDFGRAFAFETSVGNVIGDKVWLTLGLVAMTLFITYAVSIPIGIDAAVKRGSAADYGLTIVPIWASRCPTSC